MMLTLRYNRNPVIGDKFSSRHGQKVGFNYLFSCFRLNHSLKMFKYPVCLSAGCVVGAVAARGHAVHGEWHESRHHHQPARLPLAYDHRHVDREHGRQVWCTPRSVSAYKSICAASFCLIFSCLESHVGFLQVSSRTAHRFGSTRTFALWTFSVSSCGAPAMPIMAASPCTRASLASAFQQTSTLVYVLC